MCGDRLHTCDEVDQIFALVQQVNELTNELAQVKSQAMVTGKLYADVSDPGCYELQQFLPVEDGIPGLI
jgi:hypothetical protein